MGDQAEYYITPWFDSQEYKSNKAILIRVEQYNPETNKYEVVWTREKGFIKHYKDK